MAEETGIPWADSTFNGWIGCNPVSPGCANCYAARSTPARVLHIIWGPHEPRWLTSDANWAQPRRWNAAHNAFFEKHGRRRRVFCASLSDVFDNRADPAWRERLWRLVRATPNLDWLILTKRVGNVRSMLPQDWGSGYPNVWLGISVVNQEEVDRDVPKLLSIPARVRWLSLEPLLGPVSLGGFKGADLFVDWVVVGGESGDDARPMEEVWVRPIRQDSEDLGAAFFYKQKGGTDRLKGGCLLDGVEVKAFPLAA
ncbi:phage Gp37/Gp68 family protein [Ottowia sp.]|uniref:phage Gp37/Gp68 family protein n=1 Tax=Ottowia sp. TaxID=1898956 RepID=UPI0025DACE09|nr:phage Gp37/Gp68 family protein [Ottowia sp.]MBK6616603.1 phage Gp37/Gp68 family protein [Ottowia sp.]